MYSTDNVLSTPDQGSVWPGISESKADLEVLKTRLGPEWKVLGVERVRLAVAK